MPDGKIGGFEKMNINGIGTTGYPAWQGARKAESSTKGECEINRKRGTYRP